MLQNIKNFRLTLIILLLAFGKNGFGQLTVNTTLTPTQLVQNVLLGVGVTASNITYTGSTQARGEFNFSGTSLGLSGGVILSSGAAANEAGNNSISASTDFSLSGDGQLDNILASTGNPLNSFDAAILEFDFVPKGDTLKFRYVFASEEYPTFANSNYNDIFAFLITGPNSSGPNYNSTNLALIPGTTTPVTINNVNNGTNNSGPCENCQYYINNSSGNTLTCGAYTTVFTAIATVICGQAYHIKLAIADVGDGTLDSGVFLEAGSFSSDPIITVLPDMTVGLGDTVLFEGCGAGNFTITRSAGLNLPLDIRVDAFGSATPMVDYSDISDTIHFNAGQSAVTITVEAPFEGITEGMETVQLRFITPPNSCGFSDTSFFNFYISELPPIATNITATDTVIECAGDPVTLTASYVGSLTSCSIHWNTPTGDSVPVITVSPLVTTTYIVVVSDSCGNTFGYDTLRIKVFPIVPISILYPNDTVVCMNDSLLLPAIARGGQGLLSYQWSDQSIGDSILNYHVPQGNTIHTLTVRDQCSSVKTKTINIFGSQPNARFSYIIAEELGSPVWFANESSPTAITHNWNFGDGAFSNESSLTHQYPDSGNYTVSLAVSDQYNCVDTATQDITVLPEFFLYTPNAFTADRDDINACFKSYGFGIKEYELHIYNRWGQEVFKTTDINEGWYGKKCEVGVYIYTLKATGFRHGEKFITSTVTLLR